MIRIFAPDFGLLSIPLNFKKLFLRSQFLFLLLLFIGRGITGIFGISIPANYGQWFGQIYELYLKNQDVITNARKAYTAYKAVSNAVDALEGLSGAEREEFGNRWRRNMRIMLETQIWFKLDQKIWKEPNGAIAQIITEVLGLTFNEEGDVAIDINAIDALGIKVLGDTNKWEELFLDADIPKFPQWFLTRDEFNQVSDNFLQNQEEYAFTDMRRSLETHLRFRLLAEISSDPLRFLRCQEGKKCYSPFNFAGGNGTEHGFSWNEILDNMYRRDIPLHDPNPLPGELEVEGGKITDYDAYLHRRVCALIWRQMGDELLGTLKDVHASFNRKCHEINAAIYDIENLVKFLENVVTPLTSWDAEDDGLAVTFATALDILAGGAADEQAMKQSYFQGAISKKIETALIRTREVKRKLKEADALFVNLISQIEKVKERKRDSVNSMVQVGFDRVAKSMARSEVPPHNFVGATKTFYRLSANLCDVEGQ